MKKKLIISIVIPVYNEEQFIQTTLEKVLSSTIEIHDYSIHKEIVVVDDASSDNTVTSINRFINKRFSNRKTKKINQYDVAIATDDTATVIFHQKQTNQGKGSALRIGFSLTSGDIVIVQDADLEYSPDEYHILLQPFLKNNAEVVYGSRFVTNRPHRVLYFWHYVANIFLTTLSNMFTNLNLSDMETGFKVFKGDIIRNIAPTLESNKFGFEPEITAKLAKKRCIMYEVGISYSGRTFEEGKKIQFSDGLRAIWEIVKFNSFK